jgi:hypothetical protein
MIGKQYKAHKDNVIDICSGYKKRRGDFDDGIDIKFLESRISSLKNGKFTLSVAGEVKAGKSTFINALLGAEILPSDVLQASSAIVEIFKSEKSFLKVKYANGKEESIYDDLETLDVDEAKERLHEICKISDEYRSIPTTSIDTYIIENDTELEVNTNLIEQLEQQSTENLQGKESIIEKYIKDRTKDTIPIEISFGYPLKWDFDELRIVDSPGVNATGGVQDVSLSFFEQANAILFVHPIKPIESESFRKFVNSVISNRSKETLFLVLTHAGLYSDDEVERLHTEAGRLYKDIIPRNRILVVDSLLKLIHSDLDNGISVKEIRKTENKKKILSSYREQAEDEERELSDVIYESSRFSKMFAAIDEFSMKAPSLQLQEILEKIKKGYEEQENQYTEKTERLKKKKKKPQEFENEINRINQGLDAYKLLTRETKDDLTTNYTDRKSDWIQKLEALKKKYDTLIDESPNKGSARKHMLDVSNDLQYKIDAFSTELTNRLKDILKKEGNSFKGKHQISIPQIDLEAIGEKAKLSAYYDIDICDEKFSPGNAAIGAGGGAAVGAGIGAFFGPLGALIGAGIGSLVGGGGGAAVKKEVQTGTKKVFSDEKYLDELKKSYANALSDIVSRLTKKSREFLELNLKLFETEMISMINERQKALEKEKDNKQTNEELIDEIKTLDGKKKAIQPEMLRLIEILEDIK